jgi:primosomal protein N'
MQIILQAKQAGHLSELFSRFRRLKQPNSSVGVQVDVDPVNLL